RASGKASRLRRVAFGRISKPSNDCSSRRSHESGDGFAAGTIRSSRAGDAETMATSTTASIANTPAGARADFANRLQIAVLRPAEGKLFGIENLRMLSRRATAPQRESLAAGVAGRGITLLKF